MLLLVDGSAGLPAQGAGSPHRFERARHDLRGARAIRIVGNFRVQEFGVGEDHAELIVQTMEEETQLRHFVHQSPRRARIRPERVAHQA